MNNQKTKKLVGLAIFTALVVALQFLGAFIRFGMFSISLVLVPIVIGAAMYGYKAGAWLGFVFGGVVLLSGDAAAFLAVNAWGTVLTVLVKGTLAGLCAGLTYHFLAKKNTYLAVAASAVVCPLVNTGVFLLGCYVFFLETVAGWAVGAGFGNDVAKYMFLGLAGGNFLLELGVNLICASVILRIIKIGKKDN